MQPTDQLLLKEFLTLFGKIQTLSTDVVFLMSMKHESVSIFGMLATTYNVC